MQHLAPGAQEPGKSTPCRHSSGMHPWTPFCGNKSRNVTTNQACAYQIAVHNLCWSALQAAAVHLGWQHCCVAEGLIENAVNHNQPAGALDAVATQGLLRRLLAENCCLLQGPASVTAEVQPKAAAERLRPWLPLPTVTSASASFFHTTVHCARGKLDELLHSARQAAVDKRQGTGAVSHLYRALESVTAAQAASQSML